jgi:hypothetical protein
MSGRDEARLGHVARSRVSHRAVGTLRCGKVRRFVAGFRAVWFGQDVMVW